MALFLRGCTAEGTLSLVCGQLRQSSPDFFEPPAPGQPEPGEAQLQEATEQLADQVSLRRIICCFYSFKVS